MQVIVQWKLSNLVTLGTNRCGLIRQVGCITSDLCNMVDNVVLAALYSLRLRSHVVGQSKNRKCIRIQLPRFCFLHCSVLAVLQAEANGMWAWCFRASMLALAHTHEPAKKSVFFFDRCCSRARASILCEYKG